MAIAGIPPEMKDQHRVKTNVQSPSNQANSDETRPADDGKHTRKRGCIHASRYFKERRQRSAPREQAHTEDADCCHTSCAMENRFSNMQTWPEPGLFAVLTEQSAIRQSTRRWLPLEQCKSLRRAIP
ncbi:hypothetical protein AB672_04585 [Xylella taiwanensis]|nr:hypothetical protein AB672_04585 [Xylella taiwanensis]